MFENTNKGWDLLIYCFIIYNISLWILYEGFRLKTVIKSQNFSVLCLMLEMGGAGGWLFVLVSWSVLRVRARCFPAALCTDQRPAADRQRESERRGAAAVSISHSFIYSQNITTCSTSRLSWSQDSRMHSWTPALLLFFFSSASLLNRRCRSRSRTTRTSAHSGTSVWALTDGSAATTREEWRCGAGRRRAGGSRNSRWAAGWSQVSFRPLQATV